jgi:hypothetical protein
MKLATLRDGTPVGRLNVVSRDLKHAAPAAASKTLQQAPRTGPASSPT